MTQSHPSVPYALPMAPLRIPGFRNYLASRFMATLAQTGMMLIISWQTYNIARVDLGMSLPEASAQLGLIGLAQFLPLFLLTLVTGWTADHFDRRTIIRASMALLVAVSVTLGVTTWEGWLSLPLIFALAVLLGVVRAFNGPAMSALAPNLVPREMLPNAIALSSVAWQVATIIGPALGCYVYAIEPWFSYAATSNLLILALCMMLAVPKVPQPPRQTDCSPIRQMTDGLAYVRQNRLMLAVITLDLCAVFLAGVTALLPAFSRDILHVGSAGLGHLAAAPAIGASAVALWFSLRPLKTNVGKKMLGAVVVFGLATIAFGCSAFVGKDFAMLMALGSMLVWGAADMFSVYVRSSLLQLHTPDEMRGRVSSVSQLTISASNELGEAESGFLAALIGPVAAVIAGGGGAIIIALIWARLYPELGLAKTFCPPDTQTADAV